MSKVDKVDITRAYRRLYRAGLQAVMYSKPARYVVRDQLRAAFRDEQGGAGGGQQGFDMEKVRRTELFLRSAGRERGLAHRIVKNLVRVAWHRQNETKVAFESLKFQKPPHHIKRTAYDHYEQTVDMLNRTMRLCLR